MSATPYPVYGWLMPSNFIAVSPHDMVPPAASNLWPEMLPVHGLAIITGLRPNGGEAVHVVHNTDAPLWVLIGLLETVRADLLNCWQSESYDASEEE